MTGMRLFWSRRCTGFFAIALIAALLPPPALAADGALTGIADATRVTRGAFLKEAMDTLRVHLMDETRKLPYRRVPADLEQYVRTAKELGYLKVFGTGTDLFLTRSITKGEAVWLLATIENVQSSPKFKARFRDVRPWSPSGRAVMVAVERKWMEPESKTVFGVARPLTGKQARSLFSNFLLDQELREGLDAKRIPIIRIKDRGDAPKESLQETVWDIIKSQYLYEDRIEADQEDNASIEGMVKSLKDPHTTYLKPQSATNFKAQLQGEVTGIGAVVKLNEQATLQVEATLPDSPALSAGLRAGDEIIAVDDVSIVGFTLENAVERVRGPEGSTVRLLIRRAASEFEVQVVRKKLHFKEVETSMVEGVAVVKVIQFGQPTIDTFRKAVEDALKNSPKGIVLDLRGNPGGYLSAAEKVMSAFVPQGSVYVRIHTRKETLTDGTNLPPVVPASLPVVVLVNKGSASASEIVAGAMRALRGAAIVGENSFGKGTVQNVFTLDDGSIVKLTTAEFFTPDDKKIDGVGVKPDHEIPPSDSDDAADPQLAAALKLITQ